jgi:fatty acid-binding protein DegV
MTVKIVTDSSNTMEQDLAQELGITIVPLTSMVDGVVYSDLDLKEGQFLVAQDQSATGWFICRDIFRLGKRW